MEVNEGRGCFFAFELLAYSHKKGSPTIGEPIINHKKQIMTIGFAWL
jgi:hypothetical protein